MSDVRVLVVSPVYRPATGGIETLTSDLIAGLDDCAVRVSTLAEPDLPPVDDGAVTVRRYRNKPRGGRRAVWMLCLWALRDAVRFRPDVIVCMHARCAPVLVVYRLLSRSCRLVQYFHAKEIAVWPGLSRWALRSADVCVAVSTYTHALLDRTGGDVSHVVVIPPGIEVAAGAGALPVTQRASVVAVGRMAEPYKGFDVLLQAWATVANSCPDAELVLIGDGAERPALERAAEGLPRVRFLGAVDAETRDRHLDQARVFALPSRTSADGRVGEGFGIVYLEAAARGVPVVAANEGGATDAVADGRTGHLVDPRDATAVAEAICALLADDGLAGAMSSESKLWALEFGLAELHAKFRAASGLEPVSNALVRRSDRDVAR